MGRGPGGFTGWVAGAGVRMCAWLGRGGLRGWRTVHVSQQLLIIAVITNQLANRTGPGGLTLTQPVQN